MYFGGEELCHGSPKTVPDDQQSASAFVYGSFANVRDEGRIDRGGDVVFLGDGGISLTATKILVGIHEATRSGEQVLALLANLLQYDTEKLVNVVPLKTYILGSYRFCRFRAWW